MWSQDMSGKSYLSIQKGFIINKEDTNSSRLLDVKGTQYKHYMCV